jgi:anti-sigma factor RsiW
VMAALRRPCADHRAALLDFVDRRERTEATAAALDHLERCRACERELTELALAIAALRRLQAHVACAEPAPDGWLRLQARITVPADPWRWRATLGGLATSALLVATFVMPVTIGAPATHDMGLALADSPAAQVRETAYLASIRVGRLPSTPRVTPVVGSIPAQLPPEIAEVRKEVTSVPPMTARLPGPI